MIVCTLISGCGLFKNNSKNLLIAKSAVELEQRKSTELDFRGKSNVLDINTSVKSIDKLKRTNIKADKVNFNSDGSFNAEGDVQLDIEESEKLRQLDSAFKKLQSDISYYLTSSEELKTEKTDYKKDLAKISEPSGKGVFSGMIAFLGIILFFMIYFGIYPNNKN
ncbi:hypothetical protein SMI01S_11560 [Sphingobacterium mizutaii NBRC 14946 = DSM 11724]|uniref:Uncharacterized protein n=1 Tax=Sphingobacterium mizutaii NBRC 14946 = DSM 11724 TaxID=1220576 RepID=A0ABQ0W103_9SPHI|nr:hypothetical protein SMI01S_11560 [Sphingobacterium mizutaii NBRC 14946 = DSM 11724]